MGQHIVVTGQTMLLFEGIWTLGRWVRKAVECFKHGLMRHLCNSLEDSGAKSYLNCGDLNQEAAEDWNVSM